MDCMTADSSVTGYRRLEGPKVGIGMDLEILCRTSKRQRPYRFLGRSDRRRRFRNFGLTQLEIKLTHISKWNTRLMFGRPWTQLRRKFREASNQLDHSLPLIFIFDEARTLCDYDAYTGDRIYEEHIVNLHQPKERPKIVQTKTTLFGSFSNFRALRRALRYLSVATTGDAVPRIFAVFTDTTSRITNFQPTPWNDPSLRVQSLPQPGQNSFRQSSSFPVSTFILGC